MTSCVEVAPTTSVDVQLLIERPKAALLGTLKLLPGWEKAREESITVEQFSGAMTNLVYRCGLLVNGKEEQVVLMRVHASASALFDRAAEISTFQGVSQAGMGPKLLMLFENGRVEEFLSHHVTLGAADIHEPDVSAALAETLAHFHIRMSDALAASPYHQGAVQLWGRLQDWLLLTQQQITAEELHKWGMAGLEAEITQLQEVLASQHPCWIALCHNDLQYGNIMALAEPECTAAAAGGGGAGGLDQQFEGLDLDHTPFAGESNAAAAALQQQQQQQASSDMAAHEKSEMPPLFRGHSIDSLPSEATDYSTMAMAGSSPTPSISNMLITHSNSSGQLHLRGRSPGRSVQLQDGSLVLPGMRVRPRGQSPDRGKRPDYFPNPTRDDTKHSSSSKGPSAFAAAAAEAVAGLGLKSVRSSGSGAVSVAGGPDSAAAAASGTSTTAAAAAAAGSPSPANVSRLEAQLSMIDVSDGEIKPPSTASVLRHAASTGELFMSAGIPGAAGAGATAAAAEAAAAAAATVGKQRRRCRISSSGLDSSESAEDSDAADDILHSNVTPAVLAVGSPTEAAAGSSSSSRLLSRGADGVLQPSALAADAAAASAKSAAYYRKLRRERKRPAEGIEFPTFEGSDVGSSSSSSNGSSDDDEGSPPEDDQTDRCIIGRSSSSSSGLSDDDRDVTAAAEGKALAAAAAAGRGSSSGSGPPITSEPDHPQKALTLIDYEYSGFNPVAYDIANHWCEWAADYHADQPHVLDFSKLPDAGQQRAFVEAYLRELLASSGVTVADHDTGSNADGGAGLGRSAVRRTDGWQQQQQGSDAGSSMDGAESLEDLWSTLSSRGGSVMSTLSMAENNMETLSQCSVALSTKSLPCSSSSNNEPPAAATAAAAGVPRLAKLAAAAAGSNGPAASWSAASGLSNAELRSLWRWVDLHQPDRHLLLTRQQLDLSCFRRMVSSLAAAAAAYMSCSHLLWALWGVIQNKVSDVDFDFEGYAQQRWQQYLLTRPQGLGRSS